MKLKDCKYGKMVIDENLRVGFIIGLRYNICISLTGRMSDEEKFKCTIPLVAFPEGEVGIHHGNLKPF